MNKESKLQKEVMERYYGKNYKKVTQEKPVLESKLKKDFQKKYPSADMTMFKFQVTFSQDGSVNTSIIWFQDPEEEISSFDITSGTFKNNPEYTQYLYWPRGWNTGGKVPEFTLNDVDPFPGNNILMYISETEFFSVLLDPVDTSYSGTPTTNIRTEEFNYLGNPYFTALASSYVCSYLCGISEEHFLNKVLRSKSHYLTSIARYHYVFHFRRFMKNPSKLSRFMTSDVIKILRDNIPTEKKWIQKYDSSSAQLNVFKKKLKDTGKTFRNVRLVPHGNYGASTSYDELIWSHAKSKDDYKLFIPKKTTGLTKLGEKLFQHSLQSYVYSILGAQAKTRWAIVGEGGKSLQTQEVFKQLMNDTLTLDDITVSISNMRQAIKSTNVVLNYAISPGLILIPGNLIILKNSVPGFNNVFTLVTQTMSFGNNKNLNVSSAQRVKKTTNDKPSRKDKPIPKLEYPTNPDLVLNPSDSLVLPAVFGGSLIGVFMIKSIISVVV